MAFPEGDAELDAFFGQGEFDQAATYTAPSGSPVSCRVLLDEGVEVIDRRTQEVLDVSDVIYLRIDEVADPVRDATIVIGSDTYRVNQVTERDRNVVGVAVRKD